MDLVEKLPTIFDKKVKNRVNKKEYKYLHDCVKPTMFIPSQKPEPLGVFIKDPFLLPPLHRLYIAHPQPVNLYLGIKTLLNFCYGSADIRVKYRFFLYLVNRVYSCGVVFAAKLSSDLREAKM